jgi:hypothetical protein
VVLTPLDPPCPLSRLGILRIRDEEEGDEKAEDQPLPLHLPLQKPEPRKPEPRNAEPPAYKDEAKPLSHREESERGPYQDDIKASSTRDESARGADPEDAKASYSLQGPTFNRPAYARQDSLGSSTSSTSSWSRQDSLASSSSSYREEDEAGHAQWGAHPPRKQGSTSGNVRTALARIRRGPQPF